MANSAGDQGAVCTIASIGGIVIAPWGGGPFQTASVAQVVADGLANSAGVLNQTNVNGQAIDLWLKASDCGTGVAGRGGNVYSQIGAQTTSGGNGSWFYFDQTGATVATMDNTGKWLIGSSQDVGLDRAALGIFKITNATTGGGSLSFAKGGANTTVTGTVSDLALDSSGFQRLTGASTPILNSIAPPSGGAHVDGRQVVMVNIGATSIVLKHATGATATNQLYIAGAADITWTQNKMVDLIYDATDNGRGGPGWRCSSQY